MPKKKPSALDALARHNDERRIMEDRGAELRRAAALELGLAVLDAGCGSLTVAEVKQVILAATRGASAIRNQSADARPGEPDGEVVGSSMGAASGEPGRG